MVFGGFCFKQMLLYSGFCDTIYGEIYTWRIQWIWVQMGIWQPHKGQMQPIVPKCSQTHTFWGTFFKFDPHCVYVVRIAVSYKHILWLWLWLFSSTGMPVQSDCQYSVYLLRTCVWLAHMSQMQHRYSNLGVGYAQRVGLWASSSLEQKWMEQREYVETDPSPNGFAREPGWKYQKPLRKPKKKNQRGQTKNN